MKYRLFVLFVAIALTACKNGKKEEQTMPDDATHSDLNTVTTIMRGEFIYLEDVAVFTTNSAIYEVIQDVKMQELLSAAQPFKKDGHDMVIATLKVVVIPNPKRQKSNDVWEKAIEIKEIMEIKPASSTTTVEIK